jgi:hypothetical protein
MPAGSNATLMARNAATSLAPNRARICGFLFTPMPCSPVMVPPSSSAASEISAAPSVIAALSSGR